MVWQELLVQQSSAKRLEERIQSASKEKNRLEGELMTLQSELKNEKKAKQGMESENTKLSGEVVLCTLSVSGVFYVCPFVVLVLPFVSALLSV